MVALAGTPALTRAADGDAPPPPDATTPVAVEAPAAAGPAADLPDEAPTPPTGSAAGTQPSLSAPDAMLLEPPPALAASRPDNAPATPVTTAPDGSPATSPPATEAATDMAEPDGPLPASSAATDLAAPEGVPPPVVGTPAAPAPATDIAVPDGVPPPAAEIPAAPAPATDLAAPDGVPPPAAETPAAPAPATDLAKPDEVPPPAADAPAADLATPDGPPLPAPADTAAPLEAPADPNPTLAAPAPDALAAVRTVTLARPVTPGTVLVDVTTRRLVVATGERTGLSFPVTTARPNIQFLGETRVTLKRRDPTWTPTPNQRRLYRGLPGSVGPGRPENPLGSRALNLTVPNLRIHGTNEPHEIGDATSDGCIRLLNAHIEQVFDLVPVGARVIVTRDLDRALEGRVERFVPRIFAGYGEPRRSVSARATDRPAQGRVSRAGSREVRVSRRRSRH